MATLIKSWKNVLGSVGNIASRCFFRRNASLNLTQKTRTEKFYRNDVPVWNLCMLFSRAINLSTDQSRYTPTVLYHQHRWASSSSYSPDKIKDLSQVVKDVMDKEGVDELKIPKENTLSEVHGFAKFRCSNPSCPRVWESNLAHAEIDLKKQSVTKLYKQTCEKCLTENEPSFSRGEFKRIFQKKIKRMSSNSSWTDDEIVKGGPGHNSQLCEKCGYGKTQCWTQNDERKTRNKY